MTTTDILTRLKAATGPDRDLDLAIGEFWPDPKPFSQGIMQQRGGKPPVFGFTASIDSSIALVERLLLGWSWRVAICCVSDDAWVIPDFNHPIHGRRLLAEWPLECQSDPLEYLKTDIDRRPAGNPALALLEALFTALAAKEAELES